MSITNDTLLNDRECCVVDMEGKLVYVICTLLLHVDQQITFTHDDYLQCTGRLQAPTYSLRYQLPTALWHP